MSASLLRVPVGGLFGLVLGVLFGMAAAASPSIAQEAPQESARDTSDIAMYVQMSDSVVVTASRYAEPARLTGRRVDVWTRQDIQQLPVTTVDQLLDVVAGLDVKSRGAFGVQSDLTMRGSTFNGVLMLVDGARVNDPMTGHFLMDLPIPLAEIDRIEVLRGPATALYGPDALGGVVQIFTRTGQASTSAAEDGWGADLSGQFGDFELYEAAGQVRRARGHGRYSVSAVAQGSEGQPILDDDGQPIQSSRGMERTDFTRAAGTAAMKTKLGDGSVYARFGIDDRDFSAYHYYGVAGDTAREATQTLWAQVRLTGDPQSDTQWRVQVAGKQHHDDYQYNPQLPASLHTSRMLTVQGQASRALSSQLTLTGGASGRVRGIDSNTLGLRSDVAGGVFASARFRPTDRLTFNGSLRLDGDPLYGVEPTPQLYASYTRGIVTVRAGGGRAVRAPNYVERYIDLPTTQGTADLDAERSWSGEAGGDVYLPGGVTLHLTGFWRTTRDLIDYARLQPSDDVYVARNLSKVRSRGIETEASVKRMVRGARVQLDGAYTFLDQTLDTQRPVADARYALTSPEHNLQGSASVAVGRVTLSAQATWIDRIGASTLATDRYALVHGRLAYGLDVAGARAAISVEVRNALDREYTEILDAPMPGRRFIAGVRVWM